MGLHFSNTIKRISEHWSPLVTLHNSHPEWHAVTSIHKDSMALTPISYVHYSVLRNRNTSHLQFLFPRQCTLETTAYDSRCCTSFWSSSFWPVVRFSGIYARYVLLHPEGMPHWIHPPVPLLPLEECGHQETKLIQESKGNASTSFTSYLPLRKDLLLSHC